MEEKNHSVKRASSGDTSESNFRDGSYEVKQRDSGDLDEKFIVNRPGFVATIDVRPWHQVKSKIKKEFPAVQYTAWTVSPVIGWVFHQFIPLQFHVVFGNLVGLIWSIVMSLKVKAKPRAKTKD